MPNDSRRLIGPYGLLIELEKLLHKLLDNPIYPSIHLTD